jgi:two-component system LytT family sensor kinase
MSPKAKNIIRNIQHFFSQRVVYHSLAWLAYLLTFSLFQTVSGSGSYWFYFTNELVKVAFYAAGVYFNILYLIPNYLSNKKFLTYCALLLLSTIILTPLQVFFLFIKSAQFPDYQETLKESQPWLFILTFLVVSFSSIFKIISDWVRHQRERKELETESMQSELRFLRSQINPHFLFNTLNNLYALTLKKSDKAPEIVLKLSEMMRYMLYECNERRVFLSKEVNYIRNYLDLERLRQGKNVDISFEVNGNVSNQKIAPLMFIPFLENSFKHGASNHLSDGFVHIKLEIEDNKVHLFIENSKPEMPIRHSGKRSGGIGLVNVKRRLKLLYPEQYRLKIEERPGSYRVDLTLGLD